MLPQYRKNFEPSETATIMAPMLAEFTWSELPHFYRQWQSSTMGKTPEDLEKIRTHATGPALGMPWFVYDYLERMHASLERSTPLVQPA
jgi:hypothetical protein